MKIMPRLSGERHIICGRNKSPTRSDCNASRNQGEKYKEREKRSKEGRKVKSDIA